MRTTRLLFCTLALVAACRPAAETDEQRAARLQAESDSARTEISAAMASFQTHFNAGHADSILPFYAEDAVVMPSNAPAVTGKAAIGEWMRTGFQQMPGQQMHFTVQSVVASGDMAVERGRYHFTATMGRQAIADSGKYLARWQRQGGRWLMVEDIWNSDVPAPM